MRFYYIIIFLNFFLSAQAFSNERFVCNQAKKNASPLITNFYLIDDKVIMSGATGSGEYKILKRSKNGLLAVNSSFIGQEFGLETVLLDTKNKLFIYKTLIKNTKKKNIIQVKGSCEFYN